MSLLLERVIKYLPVIIIGVRNCHLCKVIFLYHEMSLESPACIAAWKVETIQCTLERERAVMIRTDAGLQL